jgi:hypothetical protein
MTNEKAKEYFSAYSEGTLDAGLRQSFEAKLKADSNLRAEYTQFEETLKELEFLRDESIEIPFDLNERISAAIDKSIYDRKRSAQPVWNVWLRNLGFAALAAAAVVGAYLSINSGNTTGPAIGGPGPVSPTPQPIEQIQFRSSTNGVKMQYQPSDKHTVIIRGGVEGEKSVDVDARGWLNELKNDQPGSALFIVEVRGEQPPIIVIVPGKERTSVVVGHGSVAEMALAVADKYGVPVILRSSKAESEMNWNFTADEPSKAAQEAFANLPFMVDTRDGIVYIGDN